MTIEAANGRAWPPFRRYLGFVFLTFVLSLAEITTIESLSDAYYGHDDVAVHLTIVLLASLIIWMPTGLLTIFPGLWLFRRLLAAFSNLGWPAGFLVVGRSVLIFCLAALGVGWFVLLGDGYHIASFLNLGGRVSLYVAPVAALSGWRLLRSARSPR